MTASATSDKRANANRNRLRHRHTRYIRSNIFDVERAPRVGNNSLPANGENLRNDLCSCCCPGLISTVNVLRISLSSGNFAQLSEPGRDLMKFIHSTHRASYGEYSYIPHMFLQYSHAGALVPHTAFSPTHHHCMCAQFVSRSFNTLGAIPLPILRTKYSVSNRRGAAGYSNTIPNAIYVTGMDKLQFLRRSFVRSFERVAKILQTD